MKIHRVFRVFILGLMASGSTLAEEYPHIVFILVDDMGYGDPGCYNPESKIKTPYIDRLAAEGMLFTDAHAAGPLCHMSRYGLLTGRYPFRTDVRRWPTEPLIDEGQETFATLLGRKGYRTAMVGKWHLGFKETGYENLLSGGPVDRGFDSFYGMRASTDIPPYFYIEGDQAAMLPTEHIEANSTEGWSRIQGEFWREGGISPDLVLDDVLPRFSDKAIEVIENHKGAERPLLLYLAYPAPHTPWLPSETFRGKSKAGLYGDFAEMVDDEIGRVLGALDKAGMKEDTLVIFTSDNGPVWYEADAERFGHASTGEMRGMKSDAWEGGHRMPFVARWPGKVKAGSRTDQTIGFTDVLATFAEIVGVDLRPEAGPDSFSFLPVLLGTQDAAVPVRENLVMASGSSKTGMVIRKGDWKYIDQLGSGGFSQPRVVEPKKGGPTGQLYNLEKDPSETTNLYLEYPELVASLKLEIERVVEAGRSR